MHWNNKKMEIKNLKKYKKYKKLNGLVFCIHTHKG